MDKNEKEVLDTYRQERKERIAKQSKNSNKKSNSHSKGKAVLAKIAKVAVAVVIVVAILAGTLNFFGVPQRLIKSVDIDGESYSMSELSCYYMQVYNYYSSYSYYYDSNYGEGYGAIFTGYDYTVAPDKQTKKDEDGNSITWDEFFLEEAISQMASIKRYYKLALDAGIELTDDAKAEIQESIKSIQDQIDSYATSATNAASANYSISRFLTLTYGKGVTENFYEKILTEQKYVELYQEARQEELEKNYTAEKVEEKYNKDTTAYDVVSFRWYTIKIVDDASKTKPTDKQIAAAEQSAQTFIDSVKSQANYNEETFKKVVLDTVDKKDKNYETYKEDNATLLQKAAKATISSNISDDAAKWLFEKNSDGKYVRQVGEMKYFVDKDKETVYILYATGTPVRDETKPTSVRHILVKFPDPKKTATETASGETVTGEEETSVDTAATSGTVTQADKDKCRKDAEKILKEYKDYIAENFDGKADEEYFIELVKEHSDDKGSVSNGGLIENMKNDGSYVPAFEDWAFSEGEFKGQTRKAGETAIIETEYGYHIMYYVGESDHAEWYNSILHELVDADWEKEQKDFEKTFTEDSIQQNETVVGWVKDACLKMIG